MNPDKPTEIAQDEYDIHCSSQQTRTEEQENQDGPRSFI